MDARRSIMTATLVGSVLIAAAIATRDASIDVVAQCQYEPGNPPPPTQIYSGLFNWTLSDPWPASSTVYGGLATGEGSGDWFSHSGFAQDGWYYTQGQNDFSTGSGWYIMSADLSNASRWSSPTISYYPASQTCLGAAAPGVALALTNVSGIPAVLTVPNSPGSDPFTVMLDKNILQDVGPIGEQYNNPYDWCGFARVGSVVGTKEIKLVNPAFFFRNANNSHVLFYDTVTGEQVASVPLPTGLSFARGHPVLDGSRGLILVQNNSNFFTQLLQVSATTGDLIASQVLIGETTDTLVPTFEASVSESRHTYYFVAYPFSQDAFMYAYAVDYVNQTRKPVNLWLSVAEYGGGNAAGGMGGSRVHSIAAVS